MRPVVWLLCLWTPALAGPSHFGEKLQKLLHSMREIGEELQQETSIDELTALINDWSDFKRNYERTYENEDVEQQRMKIFANNRKQIAAHNELYKKGLTTYFMGITKFADMTEAEYINRMTANTESYEDDVYDADDDGDGDIDNTLKGSLPTFVDWRENGAVTPVRDQGLNCSACWAFAATGALESHYFIKYSRLIPLSVQNLIDCSSGPLDDPYTNHGCEGGHPGKAFIYIKNEGNGIESEASYPYEAKLGKCRYRCRMRARARITSIIYLANNDKTLMKRINSTGPITATVHLSPELRFYRGGVFYNASNNTQEHSILVIGYGTDEQTNKKYWLIKNSWGTCWGMDGYLKLLREKNILQQPCYAEV